MLPELPKELKTFNDVTQILQRERANNLKRDKNYYERETDTLVGYTEYLQDILNSYGIVYQTKEEYEKEIIAENTAYFDKISKIDSEYQEQIRTIIPQAKQILLTQTLR